MYYHIHIPKLLEFALNVVCDDVTLHGKQCLKTPIPYPLYLRCIMKYADKYDKKRYSLFRFYRDVRSKADVNVLIGRHYPNVLDHVVLDDDGVNAKLITEVTQSHLVDDAVASIQRFASRCLAVDKSESMVNTMSQVMNNSNLLRKPIIELLLFYGAKLDDNDREYFKRACRCGMVDVLYDRRSIHQDDWRSVMTSGDCESIKLVHSAYRESIDYRGIDLINATVQSLDLMLELNIIQCKTFRMFENIPSFSVLQWILDHDVMEHDDISIDIARNAAHYSGHYFDMLRYLIEQRNFTVPRDVLLYINHVNATHLDVLDYLLLHGADVNATSPDSTVLERSPLLIRYWIDKELVLQSNAMQALVHSIHSDMTVAVLEMMIHKYSINVNDMSCKLSALQWACRFNRIEVSEMLLVNGAEATYVDCNTSNEAVRQILIRHGYRV